MVRNAKHFSSEYQPKKNGRPKGSLSLNKLIREVWEEIITDDQGNPKIRALLSIKAMMDKAEDGDVHAFKALAERMEGMPKQPIDINDMTDDPLLAESVEALTARLDKLLGKNE